MEISTDISSTVVSSIEFIDDLSKNLSKQLPPALPELKIVVIIPAKDEASEIEKTLLAHIDQKTKQNELFPRLNYEVIVLCHNCTDQTFEKAQKFRRAHPETNIHILELNCNIANTVGAARRVLMNIASSRLPEFNGLIASTDADTTPNNLWLCRLEEHWHTEVDLICGLIIVDYTTISGQPLTYLQAKDNYLMLQAKLESVILPNPQDPWPRHNYNWGPNLIIRKHIYQSIGGIAPLSFLEDVDLFNRVVEKGHYVKHCMETIVKTSVRINSRCIEGFGAELLVWTENVGIAYCVEGLKKLKMRFEIYSLIKTYYKSPSQDTLISISKLSHLKKKEVALLLSRYTKYEGMMIFMKQHLTFCNSWNALYPNVPILDACIELNTHLYPTSQ
ncbi:MAG: glycosyltransferase family 2 protein [Gelidibacter sp.]